MRIQKTMLAMVTVGLLASCTLGSAELQSAAPSLVFTQKPTISTLTITPTMDLIEKRRQIQTPVNTPHPIPTPIEKLDSQNYFNLHDERVEYFKDSLELTTRVLDVFVYSGENPPPYYAVKVEGVLKNVSEMPIVVRAKLNAGYSMSPEINWIISYNGVNLPNYYFADGFPNLSQEDYVTLAPGEFQRYSWAFPLELEMQSETGEKITLSGKTLQIYAMYVNGASGFNLPDDQGAMTPYYMDMHAWVGAINSNVIEVSFP